MFNTNGGFSFTEGYNLPIYLRKFYLKRTIKEYKDRNAEIEKVRQQSTIPYKK